ncbi:OLC1v1012094C1 [Oldenlandia corymbosa var. corymbosa]|uniref:OLC1v1012094C1 n=1 Tax=Oldenlandia corymbosa var. corymbosa TaxID=529605 RepID=A0AAV1DVA4_OLDCO|nr:OLC1v1012094C1 [Oldenlandia corymbosa var. corymbosa]
MDTLVTEPLEEYIGFNLALEDDEGAEPSVEDSAGISTAEPQVFNSKMEVFDENDSYLSANVVVTESVADSLKLDDNVLLKIMSVSLVDYVNVVSLVPHDLDDDSLSFDNKECGIEMLDGFEQLVDSNPYDEVVYNSADSTYANLNICVIFSNDWNSPSDYVSDRCHFTGNVFETGDLNESNSIHNSDAILVIAILVGNEFIFTLMYESPVVKYMLLPTVFKGGTALVVNFMTAGELVHLSSVFKGIEIKLSPSGKLSYVPVIDPGDQLVQPKSFSRISFKGELLVREFFTNSFHDDPSGSSLNFFQNHLVDCNSVLGELIESLNEDALIFDMMVDSCSIFKEEIGDNSVTTVAVVVSPESSTYVINVLEPLDKFLVAKSDSKVWAEIFTCFKGGTGNIVGRVLNCYLVGTKINRASFCEPNETVAISPLEFDSMLDHIVCDCHFLNWWLIVLYLSFSLLDKAILSEGGIVKLQLTVKVQDILGSRIKQTNKEHDCLSKLVAGFKSDAASIYFHELLGQPSFGVVQLRFQGFFACINCSTLTRKKRWLIYTAGIITSDVVGIVEFDKGSFHVDLGGLACPSDANIPLKRPSIEESFDFTEEMDTAEVTGDEYYSCVDQNLDYTVSVAILLFCDESNGLWTLWYVDSFKRTCYAFTANFGWKIAWPILKVEVCLCYLVEFDCEIYFRSKNPGGKTSFSPDSSFSDSNSSLETLTYDYVPVGDHCIFLPYDPAGMPTYLVPAKWFDVESGRTDVFASAENPISTKGNDATWFICDQLDGCDIADKLSCRYGIIHGHVWDPGIMIVELQPVGMPSKDINREHKSWSRVTTSFNHIPYFFMNIGNQISIQLYNYASFHRTTKVNVAEPVSGQDHDGSYLLKNGGSWTKLAQTILCEAGTGSSFSVAWSSSDLHLDWTEKVTTSRGGTSLFKGKFAEMIVTSETNFIWMIVWYLVEVVSLKMATNLPLLYFRSSSFFH